VGKISRPAAVAFLAVLAVLTFFWLRSPSDIPVSIPQPTFPQPTLPLLGGEPKGDELGSRELAVAWRQCRNANIELPGQPEACQGMRINSFGVPYVVIKYPPALQGQFSRSKGRIICLLDTESTYLDTFRPLAPSNENEVAMNTTQIGTFGTRGAASHFI